MKQKLQNINRFSWLLIALLVIMSTAGCKKFLEVKAPSTSVNQENVYKSNETAIAVLTQIYTTMVTDGVLSGQKGVSILSALSADELTISGTVTDEQLLAYYRNQLRTGTGANFGTNYWDVAWQEIFACNAAIEGLNHTMSLTDVVKKQLLGEAKFMRAFLYFYLVNFYGDVPLVLTTNANVSKTLPRSPKQEVYTQIVADLKEAQQLLSDYFLDNTLLKSSLERVRPTQWAATALLARTYLYLGRYAEAEAEASKVIANSSQFSLAPIDGVFLRNSTEAIWQMQPVVKGRNTEDGFTFILPSTGPNRNNNPVYLSSQILNAFETGDRRRKSGGWVDSVNAGGAIYFFPAKYRATSTSGTFTEYLMILRLAEQYLIRAESRARQNNIECAKDDLNMIRARAALLGTTANDQPSLLAAIFRERQVELFTELGHRWLDLKRSGNVDSVMTHVTPLKANGSSWQSYQQLYPLRYNDIQKNPNLAQNPGY